MIVNKASRLPASPILLQGLGFRPADRVQPRLAAIGRIGIHSCCFSCITAIASSPMTDAATVARTRPATATTWTITPMTWRL